MPFRKRRSGHETSDPETIGSIPAPDDNADDLWTTPGTQTRGDNLPASRGILDQVVPDLSKPGAGTPSNNVLAVIDAFQNYKLMERLFGSPAPDILASTTPPPAAPSDDMIFLGYEQLPTNPSGLDTHGTYPFQTNSRSSKAKGIRRLAETFRPTPTRVVIGIAALALVGFGAKQTSTGQEIASNLPVVGSFFEAQPNTLDPAQIDLAKIKSQLVSNLQKVSAAEYPIGGGNIGAKIDNTAATAITQPVEISVTGANGTVYTFTDKMVGLRLVNPSMNWSFKINPDPEYVSISRSPDDPSNVLTTFQNNAFSLTPVVMSNGEKLGKNSFEWVVVSQSEKGDNVTKALVEELKKTNPVLARASQSVVDDLTTKLGQALSEAQIPVANKLMSRIFSSVLGDVIYTSDLSKLQSDAVAKIIFTDGESGAWPDDRLKSRIKLGEIKLDGLEKLLATTYTAKLPTWVKPIGNPTGIEPATLAGPRQA